MRRRQTYKWFLLALSCWMLPGRAQDLHFSQFFEAPLLRNPSLAGIFEGDFRTQIVYRNQWGSVTVPFQTGSLNSEYKFHVGKGNDFMTVGAQILWDKAGTVNLRTTHLLPAVNYHKSLNDDKNRYISLGFMGGYVSRQVDRSRIQTPSQFDGFTFNGGIPDGESFGPNYNYVDMSVGMTYNSSIGDNDESNFFVGAAYHHINEPQNSFYKTLNHLPKWVFSGGLRMPMGEVSYLTFHADYSSQGPYTEVIGGATYSHKFGASYDNPDYIVHLGTYLRWGDAFIPVVKLDYRPFAISFSYDLNVSTLRTASQGRGAFEISLTYLAFFDRDQSTRYSTRCPRF